MTEYGYYGENGALLDVGYTCPPKNRFKTNVFYTCDVLSSGEVVGHGGRIKGVDVVGFRFTSKHCGEVRLTVDDAVLGHLEYRVFVKDVWKTHVGSVECVAWGAELSTATYQGSPTRRTDIPVVKVKGLAFICFARDPGGVQTPIDRRSYMPLIEYTLDGRVDKVQKAIDRIRNFEPVSHGFDDKPYYVCYSGGKDSDCIRILCELAGVPHELVCNWTGIDAPETWEYIHTIPNLRIDLPRRSMFQLIVDNGIPPTRTLRYCCKELKEHGGEGRFVMTGVRWAESVKRAKNRGVIEELGARLSDKVILNSDNADGRKVLDVCMSQHKRVLNPIVDWTDGDVWEFLDSQGCEANPLYQCGFKRVGCIGCPQCYYRQRESEFTRYPGYKSMYLNAFKRMLEVRASKGKGSPPGSVIKWDDAESVFHWWMYEDRERHNRSLDGQLDMFEDYSLEQTGIVRNVHGGAAASEQE